MANAKIKSMLPASINQIRFDLLRGYYQKGEFHPAGGQGVCLDEFLNLLGFKNIVEFKSWYVGLSPEEIKEGKKDWCSGNCCQSNLVWLSSDNVENKTVRRKISLDEFKKAFPKNYERLLRLRGLKQKALDRLNEIRSQKTPSKILHKQSREEFEMGTKRLNEYSKKHPEALLRYLYQTGQLTDLTNEDIKKLNEYVRQQKKEDPHCEMWEIEEKPQEIFTTESIKDPATRERWHQKGQESAQQLVENLKEGIRENQLKDEIKKHSDNLLQLLEDKGPESESLVKQEMQQINDKLKLTPEQKKKFIEKVDDIKKHQQDRPDKLLWYIYEITQFRDLTIDDIIKINERVIQKRKKEPYYNMWDIRGKEAKECLQS